MKRESRPHGSKDFEYHPHKVDDLDHFRSEYDRIFKKGIHATDPIHSLTPGTVREYRSDCCCEPVAFGDGRYVCNACYNPCNPTMTKINP